MPEFIMILIRAIISFVVLFLMTRWMGKTQLSQLTFFDYVVGITIGSIAATLSVDQNVKMINGLVSILVWAIFPILISLINLKSYHFRKFTDGRPTVLVENGKIIESNLKSARVTVEELMVMLRQKNSFKLSDVEFAILETNGRLSVLQKTEVQPITAEQLKIPVKKEGNPRIVLIDGNVMERTLSELGYTKQWLIEQIQKKGAKSLDDVFLAQVNTDGTLYVDLKESS